MIKKKAVKKYLSYLLVLVMLFSLAPGIGAANSGGDGGDDEATPVQRLAGADRYATAAQIARYAYPDSADTIILARGDDYADGMAGSALAGALEAPLLLTSTSSLPGATAETMEALGATKAVLLGGTAAISAAVADELANRGLAVERVYGSDRYETAVKIAEKIANERGDDFPSTAFIVAGTAYADSLVAGVIAAAQHYPILQVTEDTLPSVTTAAIKELEIENLLIIGGTAVISEAVELQLKEIVDGTVERIAGADRYQTSTAVAARFFDAPGPSKVILANGLSLVDALAGGYLGAILDAPVLYLNGLPETVVDYLDSIVSEETQALILGGSAAISEAHAASLARTISYGRVLLSINSDLVGNYRVKTGVDGVFGHETQVYKIDGTLYVDPGDDGSVTIRNIEADNIVILSGAPDSVILLNITVHSDLTIATSNPEVTTHVEIQGNSSIAVVNVQTNVTFNLDGSITVGLLIVTEDADGTTLTTTAEVTVNDFEISEETMITINDVPITVDSSSDEIDSALAGDAEQPLPGGGGGGGSVAVSAISVEPKELTLLVEETAQLTATVTPSNATNKKINWSSSDEGVATIDNGVVTAVAVGEATITAKTVDGDFTATSVVTVIKPLNETANVAAGDFSVMTISGVIGYNVGFNLIDATAADVKSVVVALYGEGDEVLATNNSAGVLEKYTNATSLSAPFDVFGGFNYGKDGCWTYSGWLSERADIPTSAEITVTFKNGVVKRATNVNLTGDTDIFSKKVINITRIQGYDTIQAAIDAASSGDTLRVTAGTYNESITINKQLNVISTDGPEFTIIDREKINTTLVTIKADNVEFSGFTVQNAQHGIAVSSSNNTISNNIVQDISKWSTNIGGTNNLIKNNIIRNQGSWGTERQPRGLFIYGATGVKVHNNQLINAGLSFQDSLDSLEKWLSQDIDSTNTVNGKPIIYWKQEKDKTVPGNAGAVWLIDCERVTVEHLELRDTEAGIYVAYGHNNTINNNEIGGGDVILSRGGGEWNIGWRGIIVRASDNNTISGNIVLKARGGIEVRNGGYGNTISNNSVSGSREGITIHNSDATTIDGNAVHGCESGVLLWGTVKGSNIKNNNIYENEYGINFAHNGTFQDDTVQYNSITGNSNYGVCVTGQSVVDATHNYWGHESGPKHATLNSAGQGDRVSDNIIFFPWCKDVDMIDDSSQGKIVNTRTLISYPAIQTAIDQAEPGDTILVGSGTYEVTDTINVNKAITIKGTPDFATEIKTSGGNPVFTLSTAATLDRLFMLKTDKSNQHLVTIIANGARVVNSKFLGQYKQDDTEVTRAILTNAGVTDFVINGNHFENLRQPAYLEGTGTVSDNYVKNTRGWVVCVNHEVTFTGNTFEGNAVDIAIITNNQTSSEFYTHIAAISANNNGAYVENQLLQVSAKDGTLFVEAGDNQYANSIVNAVNAAQAGDTINVTGSFDGFVIDKPLTIKGGTINSTTIPATSGNIGIYVPANVTDVVFDGVTIVGTEGARIGIETGANVGLTVKDSEISGFITGIYLNPGSVLTATNNTISKATAGIGSDKANLTGNVSGNIFNDCTEAIGMYLPLNSHDGLMTREEAEAFALALAAANGLSSGYVNLYGFFPEKLQLVQNSGQNETNKNNNWPHIEYTVNGRNITITFKNPTNHAFAFDYRVDGEEGRLTEWSSIVIKEGELKGQEIGPSYNIVNVQNGSVGITVTVYKEIWIGLRLGSEQNWFLDWIKFEFK